MLNDYYPFSLWTEVVKATMTIVHGGQKSLIVATSHQRTHRLIIKKYRRSGKNAIKPNKNKTELL